MNRLVCYLLIGIAMTTLCLGVSANCKDVANRNLDHLDRVFPSFELRKARSDFGWVSLAGRAATGVEAIDIDERVNAGELDLESVLGEQQRLTNENMGSILELADIVNGGGNFDPAAIEDLLGDVQGFIDQSAENIGLDTPVVEQEASDWVEGWVWSIDEETSEVSVKEAHDRLRLLHYITVMELQAGGNGDSRFYSDEFFGQGFSDLGFAIEGDAEEIQRQMDQAEALEEEIQRRRELGIVDRPWEIATQQRIAAIKEGNVPDLKSRLDRNSVLRDELASLQRELSIEDGCVGGNPSEEEQSLPEEDGSKPNLVVKQFRVIAPKANEPWWDFDVEFEIANDSVVGMGDFSPLFEVYIVLSGDSQITATDQILYEKTLGRLDGKEARGISQSGLIRQRLTLPEEIPDAGLASVDNQYFFGVVIDPRGWIDESSETDNTQSLRQQVNGQAVIRLESFDVEPESFVAPSPMHPQRGASLIAKFRNTGYRTSTPVDGDFVLYKGGIPVALALQPIVGVFAEENGLRPGAEWTFQSPVELPMYDNPVYRTGSGFYSIGAKVNEEPLTERTKDTDDVFPEGDGVGYDSIIIKVHPDLVPRETFVARPFLDYVYTPEEIIQFSGTVWNRSFGEAEEYEVSVFLSADARHDPDLDPDLGRIRVRRHPGQSNKLILTREFVLPEASNPVWRLGEANYYIGMRINPGGEAEEYSFDNNTNAKFGVGVFSVPIRVDPIPVEPFLMGQEITFPPIVTPVLKGSPVVIDLIASASSGLPVRFEIQEGDGGQISGEQLILSQPGDMSIQVIQDGNEHWLPSSSVQTITVTGRGAKEVRILNVEIESSRTLKVDFLAPFGAVVVEWSPDLSRWFPAGTVRVGVDGRGVFRRNANGNLGFVRFTPR